MDDHPNRLRLLYGRRRQVPMLVVFAVVSAVVAVTARTVAGAIFELGLAVWMGTTASRYWRQPVMPRTEVVRLRRKVRSLGDHPVRGASTGAAVIAVALVALFWRKGIIASLVVGGVFGALIGIGLYFVFRTDPGFHRGDGGPYDQTGRRQLKAPRWIRWWLEAPGEVESLSVGPQDLPLDRRAHLLVALRKEIAERGFVLSEVRRSRRVLAREGDALRKVEHDEEHADLRDHWWTAQVVWRSHDGTSVVVYCYDPLGQNLTFVGWGSAARDCLAAVDSQLRLEGRAEQP